MQLNFEIMFLVTVKKYSGLYFKTLACDILRTN